MDSDRFVTGSSDCMLRFWDLTRKDSKTSIARIHVRKSRHARLLCIATSHFWFMIVSGSEDGSAVIWDPRRAIYVPSIDHKTQGSNDNERAGVRLVVINESSVSLLCQTNNSL